MFHLIATADRVLIVDDELLALADTVLVACPNIALLPYHIGIVNPLVLAIVRLWIRNLTTSLFLPNFHSA